MAAPGKAHLSMVTGATGELAVLAASSARRAFSRPWPVGELVEQCWFILRVTIVPCVLISLPFGMVVALQAGDLIQQLGAEANLGALLAITVIRESAPLGAALLLAGAAGSAICSDLGSRRIRNEIDAMEVMGVDSIQRLVMPRIAAAILMALLLNVIVVVAGIAGGWLFATQWQNATTSSFFGGFDALAQSADLWVGVVKVVTFGFLVAIAACRKGLNVSGGPQGVGIAVRESVVTTFVLLFAANFVISALYLNLVPQRF